MIDSLPYAISGFYDPKIGHPPRIDESQFKRWLFPVCRTLNYNIVSKIKDNSFSNYFYIDVANYAEKLNVLCNKHYPYIAFTSYQEVHFMPRDFVDVDDLTDELRKNPEIVILSSSELNQVSHDSILFSQPKIVQSELVFWGNTLGKIIFNDFD